MALQGPSRRFGYTRFVGRRLQQLVGAVILTVLATLPVAAATCEWLCVQPTTAASTDGTASTLDDMSMHDGMSGCHESPSPTGLRLAGAAAHDCGSHDAGLGDLDASAIRTNRVDASGMAFIADAAVFAPVAFVADTRHTRPLASRQFDTAPPQRSLVLRV